MSSFGFVILVGVSGGIGALCRWGIDLTWRKPEKRYSYGGIALVNVVSCFLGGFVLSGVVTGHFEAGGSLFVLMVTGFLGGFSTFSTFVFDVFSSCAAGKVASCLRGAGASLGGVFAGSGSGIGELGSWLF